MKRYMPLISALFCIGLFSCNTLNPVIETTATSVPLRNTQTPPLHYTNTPTQKPTLQILEPNDTSFYIPENMACITDFYTYAYTRQTNWDYITLEDVDPLPPWKFEAHLPVLKETAGETQYEELSFIRETTEGEKLWLFRKSVTAINNQEIASYTVLIYQPGAGNWETASVEINGSQEVQKLILFPHDDGVLFYAEDYTDGVFLGSVNPERIEFNVKSELPLSNPQIDFAQIADGVLFLFNSNDAIYRYDLQTKVFQRSVALPSMYITALDQFSDGTFAMYDLNRLPEDQDKDNLFYYDPASDSLTPFQTPEDVYWPIQGHHGIDQQDNLWINTFGFRTKEGVWQISNPNYLQINQDAEEAVFVYFWSIPDFYLCQHEWLPMV